MPKIKASRSVFLSFEFEKDAGRRGAFISQATKHCEFSLKDESLPAVEHDEKWWKEVKERMRKT